MSTILTHEKACSPGSPQPLVHVIFDTGFGLDYAAKVKNLDENPRSLDGPVIHLELSTSS